MTRLLTSLAATLVWGALPAPGSAQGTDTTDPESAEAAVVHGSSEESASKRGSMSDPMAAFGITARIGVAGHGSRDATVDGTTLDDAADSNAGLHFGVGLNLGDGHGFGANINFTIRRYKQSQSVGGFGDIDYKYGDFTLEPVLGARFQLMSPLYLFVGLGPRLGVGWENLDVPGFGSTIEDNTYGVVGVRLPVEVSYYFLDWMAATFEFGIGWDIWMTAVDDPLDSTARVFYNDRGITYDVVFGLRFF